MQWRVALEGSYAIYLAFLVAGVVIVLVGLAGPLISVPLLGNLFFRAGLFTIALGCRLVMMVALRGLEIDKPTNMWIAVTGGALTIMLIAQAFSIVMGVVRYFSREFDVVANERDLDESRARETEEDSVPGDWDRRYRQRRDRL